MTTVADLSVNIFANTKQVNPALDELRHKLGDTFNQAKNPVEEFSHTLHGIEGRLRSFNAVLGLGLGVHLGRHIFSELHEELSKFSEAYGEALQNGNNFFESIGEGVKHILGMKTALEETTERMKYMAETGKQIGELAEIFERLHTAKENAEEKKLPAEAQVDKEVEAAFQKTQKILREAAEARTEVTAIETALKEFQTKNFFGRLISPTGQGEIESKLEEAKKKAAGPTIRADEAEEQLKQIRAEAEKRKEQLRKDHETEEQDKRNKKLVEAGEHLLHEAQLKLAHAMEQRAQQLKHDQAAADRIRAADDAFERFRQEATEAERLHTQKLLSDDEFNTRINKLREDVTRHEAEERKKQGLFASATAGRAVEAKSLEAYHDLAEFKAGGTHNPQLDETKKTNTILLDIKANVAKQNAADNLKNLGLDLLAGIASIL